MSDPHAVVPVPTDELARLREELLQCRSKLALAAESAAGDDELIAELVGALNWFIEDRRDEYRHLDRGISVSTKRGQSLLKARTVLAKATRS